MKPFQNNEHVSHLDEALRRERPRPPRELEELLTTYMAYRPRDRRVAPRLAAAVAFSVMTAVALGALVGVGQAASGPQTAVTAVVNILTSSNSSGGGSTNGGNNNSATSSNTANNNSNGGGGGGGNGGNSGGGGGGNGGGGEHDDENDDDPSNDQYKPGKGCGDKNHVHARENECKKLK